MEDAKGSGTPLVHFRSRVAGAGRENEGLSMPARSLVRVKQMQQ
jgi:hypothetical protein